MRGVFEFGLVGDEADQKVCHIERSTQCVVEISVDNQSVI